MTDRKALKAALEQIAILVKDCLAAIDSDGTSAAETVARRVPGNAGATLPENILQLRASGFFREPRVAAEVHEALRTMYPCEMNRVEVALSRLKGRKELRVTSKLVSEKKQIAYVG